MVNSHIPFIIHQIYQQHRKKYQRKSKIYGLAILALWRIRYSVRQRAFLTANCLKISSESPWYHFYKTGNDTEFLAFTNLTQDAFQYLLSYFNKKYIIRSGFGKVGRPRRIIDKHAVLGLILHFYSGTMEFKTLQKLFRIPPATLSRTIEAAEIALAACLIEIPEAQIKWPLKNMQKEWSEKIQQKEPLLENRFCFIDGKNYRVQEPSNIDRQNAFYNGWLHSVFVTGTLAFGVDGTIIWGKHNCPGSWNDGETSRGFQNKLLNEKYTLIEMGAIADSAFPVTNALFKKIITPLKKGELEKAPKELQTIILAHSNAITAARQAAEWGIGAVSKCFRRLLNPLPYDSYIRGRRLLNIHRLYNFRVRKTNISQIRNVFF